MLVNRCQHDLAGRWQGALPAADVSIEQCRDSRLDGKCRFDIGGAAVFGQGRSLLGGAAAVDELRGGSMNLGRMHV